MLTKNKLQQMREDELSQRVLLPLLQKMGFKDVVAWHGGAMEQGKDIVCWKLDELERRTNYALVVKAVDLNGQAGTKTGNAGEVQMQIQQTFGSTFRDKVTGETQLVHQCWVVTNKAIRKEAEESIMNAISAMGFGRNIRFIDGEELWNLVQKHLRVQAVWQHFEEAQEILDNLDTHYHPQIRFTKSGSLISLVEKFPGAAKEKPLKVKAKFEFPDTPEGQALIDAIKHHFATGAPVDVPGAYIKNIEFPEFMRQLVGEDFRPSVLEMRPTELPEKYIVRVELISDDGDRFTSDHIELKVTQAGEKEITFANDEQNIPFRIRIVLRPNESNGRITVTYADGPMNVSQLLSKLKFLTCISKSVTIRVISTETNINIFEAHEFVQGVEAPNTNFINLISDLVAVQTKVKRPIIWPDRELTEDEIYTIKVLRTILRKGRLEGTWESVSCVLSPEGVKTLLEEAEGSFKARQLAAESQEIATLFGAELPLGPVRVFYGLAALANEQEARQKAQVAADNHQETSIEAEFVPEGSNKAVKIYLDWQPEPARKLRGSPKAKARRRK